jgi:hypothetical protein
MSANPSQIRWSAGKSHGRLARVDKLATLYIRLETLAKLAEPDRGELLQLAQAFAELRAACHVAKCEKLYAEAQ